MPETVVRERTLEAEPDEVWRCLTDADLLEEWLADRAEVDVRGGGEGSLVMPDGETRHVVYDEVVSGERLSLWWWSGDEPARRVEFRLVAAGRVTRLVVTETRGAPFLPSASLSALARAARLVPA
jgi:uncharacterized protein YndB with AHSA1/START domain